MNNRMYPVTIAPFESTAFKELSNTEAEEYFKWYMWCRKNEKNKNW